MTTTSDKTVHLKSLSQAITSLSASQLSLNAFTNLVDRFEKEKPPCTEMYNELAAPFITQYPSIAQAVSNNRTFPDISKIEDIWETFSPCEKAKYAFLRCFFSIIPQ